MKTGGQRINCEKWAIDDDILKKKIKDSFRIAIENSNVKLPQNIWLEEIDNGIKMSLSPEAIGRSQDKILNMQDNAAAFEGWAAAIYTHYLGPMNSKDSIKRKIILGSQEKLYDTQSTDENQGHLNRFLFRAMKFSEEYSDWIELDSNLQVIVGNFKKWYEKENLINNEPSKNRNQKAVILNNPTTESEVEQSFVGDGSLMQKLLSRANMKSEQIFRQLPVGLFKGEVVKKNSVFTGGKSAIDMWAVDDEYIALFELKTNNKMIGIITELFFYSQYVNDVFIRQNNIQCTKLEDKKIKAFFLTNGLHPLITKKVIEVLNNSNKNKDVITYADIQYDLCMKLL